MQPDDLYRTVAAPAEAACRERSSKFLAWIYPVRSEEEIRGHLDALRKRFFDATHHCYAWRLGPRGEAFRANDDGEPSGTAGKPILGQLLSNDITDCLVVVVRYFGGTKLGVPGLIAAYREAAAAAIEAAQIVERTVDRVVTVDFPYVAMNDIMRVVGSRRRSSTTSAPCGSQSAKAAPKGWSPSSARPEDPSGNNR